MINRPRQVGNFTTVTDPTREMMAKQMSVVPGGPMNNDPTNVQSAMSGPMNYPSPYGDMVTQTMPVGPAPASGMPQQMVPGRLKNQQVAFTQQPPAEQAPLMESNRLFMETQMRGLNGSPMGMIGMGVDQRMPLPGGTVPTPQQAPNTMPLSTPSPEQMAQQNSMMNRGTRTSQGMTT